jgi:CheY-like chemotaxis protein
MRPILVIDDDQQARSVVRRTLERAGYVVVEAGDGEEGTRLALELEPALVVTDIIMPNKEGLEVIRELHDQLRQLPIIAMPAAAATCPRTRSSALHAVSARARRCSSHSR